MTEQDKQALIKHFCERDCGEAAKNCKIMPCHEIELIQEFPTTESDSDTISRQAAIDMLRCYLVGKRCPDDGTLTCRLIENEVINKLPPAQPERTPIQELLDVTADRDYWKAQCHSYEMTINRLAESAQPERIKGRWIPADTQCGIKCSACGLPVDDFCYSIDYIDLDYVPNFCPNCGSDNREVTT